MRRRLIQYSRTLLHLGLVACKPLRPKLGGLRQHGPRPLRLPEPMPHWPPELVPPRISLVTPSFSQQAYIGRTLASVLDPGYANFDYFVQDGGSQDGTVELLRDWAPRPGGWASERDIGQAQAINRGFARSDGEIMGWLNSDDLLLPGALARVAHYMARHPEVDAVYGYRILIDEQDAEIGRWLLPEHDDAVLALADFVPQETLFWRRSLWERTSAALDESFQFALDWDLLLDFRRAGARIVRLPHSLGAFRVHATRKTSAAIHTVGQQEMRRLRQRELSHVPSDEELYWRLIPYLLHHVGQDPAYHLGWSNAVCATAGDLSPGVEGR